VLAAPPGNRLARASSGGSVVVLGSAVSVMIWASGALMVSAGAPQQLTIQSGAPWGAPSKSFPVLSNRLFWLMDENSATQGTSRDLRGSEIESFLKQALADGEKTVVALQEKARAAGLLGERQTITDSKSFRSAKAALGVRSHRIGFGRGATWFWALPAPPASEGTTPVTLSVDVYDVAPSDRTPETSSCYEENAGGRPHHTPIEWIRGVNILQQRPAILILAGSAAFVRVRLIESGWMWTVSNW
jgi:hypothetical protein